MTTFPIVYLFASFLKIAFSFDQLGEASGVLSLKLAHPVLMVLLKLPGFVEKVVGYALAELLQVPKQPLSHVLLTLQRSFAVLVQPDLESHFVRVSE